MLKAGIVVVLLAAIAVPSVLFATQRQQGTEARVAAYKHEDGRVEFAIQVREGDSWGERLLPRGRILGTSAPTGRWLTSTPVTLSLPETEAGTLIEEPEATSGQLGPYYQWEYGPAYERESFSRYRVEWTTATARGSKRIKITSPEIGGSAGLCDLGVHPCRYVLTFWCGEGPSLPGLMAFLQYFWLEGNRAWWDHDALLGLENRQPTSWSISTSVDHLDFANSWLVYHPRGQHGNSQFSHGVDFLLEGEAAHAFFERVQQQTRLEVTVGGAAFAFDVRGAFDNPATRLLEQCEES